MSPKDNLVDPWNKFLLEAASLPASKNTTSLKDDFDEKLDDYLAKMKEGVRRTVTLVLVWGFMLCVLIIVVRTLWPNLENVNYAEDIHEMIEVVDRLVSPVLLLVLGFYFGSSKTKG